MPLVSITRLRVRSWRYLPASFVASFRSALQARRARGNLAVSLSREAHDTFWTRSLWADEAAAAAAAERPSLEQLFRQATCWRFRD